MVGPGRRRARVEHVARHLGASEREACAALGQHRSTRREAPRTPDDEARLTADILEPAKRFGRCGHRRIAALLRRAGWAVNRERVERIWRREGLRVPPRQPRRGRLRLNDGSRVRLRPERADHVRAHDFVEGRTRDGRRFRMPCVADEFTRECPAVRVARKPGAADVIDVPSDPFIPRGVPAHVRSGQGPEFVAEAAKGRIAGVGAATAFIGKASPWENGYVESFNGKPRDELPRAEAFDTPREAQVLIERWRRHYNTARPHSPLGYRPPAPEVVTPALPRPPPRPGPEGAAQPSSAMLH